MSAAIVIVHGGWDGGWFWSGIAGQLRQRGFQVYTPTLTGLGERAHLGTPETNMDTHIQDVVGVIQYEHLNDIFLVGHSYGGAVVTGVAHRIPDRIREIVYLDALVPEDGQSVADLYEGTPIVAMMQQAAEQYGDGWRVPFPGDAYDTRVTAQPFQTFMQPLRLSNPDADRIPRTYVACVARGENPAYYPLSRVAAQAKASGWRYYELNTGHNLSMTAPSETVRLLAEICAG